MTRENSGGVLTRGYGLFSRILTRGFGRFFKTEVFRDSQKKKEPILREFTFEVYSPVNKGIMFEKEIKLNILKENSKDYFITSGVIRSSKLDYNINNKISKNAAFEYPIKSKVNNKKLINLLNLLIDDD